MTNDLPLLRLFDRLQQNGLFLGVDDYLVLLEALRGGYGLGDRKALERLCCTIWAKSESDIYLIRRLLDQTFQPELPPANAVSASTAPTSGAEPAPPTTAPGGSEEAIEEASAEAYSTQQEGPGAPEALETLKPLLDHFPNAPDQPAPADFADRLADTEVPLTTTDETNRLMFKPGLEPPSAQPETDRPVELDAALPETEPEVFPAAEAPSATELDTALPKADIQVELDAVLPEAEPEMFPAAEAPSATELDAILPEVEPEVFPAAEGPLAATVLPPPPILTLENQEPVQIVQAIRRGLKPTRDLLRYRSMLVAAYFPVTRRQMSQEWRYLRRIVRAGPAEELDILATIEQISVQGVMTGPVLVPRRVNKVQLVLMIDCDGSMTPFHSLSRQLAESAQRGGRLRATDVLYFHDFPGAYLYHDQTRLDGVPLKGLFAALSPDSVALIVSDAGAARGSYDQERIDGTLAFLERVTHSFRYAAWLNPMPEGRWKHTSAEAISRYIPMFELSRQGLQLAIKVLRGFTP